MGRAGDIRLRNISPVRNGVLVWRADMSKEVYSDLQVEVDTAPQSPGHSQIWVWYFGSFGYHGH